MHFLQSENFSAAKDHLAAPDDVPPFALPPRETVPRSHCTRKVGVSPALPAGKRMLRYHRDGHAVPFLPAQEGEVPIGHRSAPGRACGRVGVGNRRGRGGRDFHAEGAVSPLGVGLSVESLLHLKVPPRNDVAQRKRFPRGQSAQGNRIAPPSGWFQAQAHTPRPGRAGTLRRRGVGFIHLRSAGGCQGKNSQDEQEFGYAHNNPSCEER